MTTESASSDPDGPATESEAEAKSAAPTAEVADVEAAAPEKPEPPPPRDLPSYEAIAAWAAGEEVGNIGILFEGLALKRFDTFSTQIRNKEILPQHWQAISESEVPADEVFDGLPEVSNLRQRYRDQDLARRRLGAMKVAWRELRGKRPGLWSMGDLMAALRRIIQKDLEVDFNELLSGARDLWLGMTVPMGQEQVEILWASIALIRKGTKK